MSDDKDNGKMVGAMMARTLISGHMLAALASVEGLVDVLSGFDRDGDLRLSDEIQTISRFRDWLRSKGDEFAGMSADDARRVIAQLEAADGYVVGSAEETVDEDARRQEETP